MDIMVILQIIVLLGAIFLGVRLGGIGIGYAGGAGVLVLGLFGHYREEVLGRDVKKLGGAIEIDNAFAIQITAQPRE